MKRILGVLLVCLAICAGALGESGSTVPAASTGGQEPSRQSQEKDSGPALTAIGSGVVTLSPDIAVLTFRLSSTAATVAEAQGASAASAEGLYAALEGVGVSREDTHAVSYSTATLYSYQYGKLGEGESPSGFTVTSDVVVRLKDLQALGTVIDVAMQSGADSSYEMSFESSQAQAAYDRALGLATTDAMRKAELLAEASGLTLGPILSIRECGEGAAPSGEQETMPGTEVEGGLHYEIQVSAYVEVRYGGE